MTTPEHRYDMPASFGPSVIPPITTVEGATAAVVSFETDPEAIRQLVPRHFAVHEPAVVSISAITYPTTDYMGGRGYREIVISLSARHHGPGGQMQAGFAPVLWVDQFGALYAGREFQGLPKLLGEIPPLDRTADSCRFSCSEYGAPLLVGTLDELAPVSPAQLETIRRTSAAVPTFGWKYIPSPSGPPDADYPTVNYTRWDYANAWTGKGSVKFMRPSSTEAPFGARVAEKLAALPVRRWRRAFVGQGVVHIDRTMSRRLDAN